MLGGIDAVLGAVDVSPLVELGVVLLGDSARAGAAIGAEDDDKLTRRLARDELQ